MTSANIGGDTALFAAGWTIEKTDKRVDGWQAWGFTGDGREFSLIVSDANELDDRLWLHVSLYVGDDALPTYEDMALLHRAYFGRRRWAYQVFAPAADRVNIKQVLHIWGRADGKPVLPDFTHGTGLI